MAGLGRPAEGWVGKRRLVSRPSVCDIRLRGRVWEMGFGPWPAHCSLTDLAYFLFFIGLPAARLPTGP